MKIFLKAILYLLVIIFLLFITKPFLLDSIFESILIIRKKDHYVGESRAKETIDILFKIIIPILYLLILGLLFLFKIKKERK